MTSTNRTLIVHTFVGDKIVKVPLKDDTTAEDVCITVAKELKISPVARLLFALKLHGKEIFLHPGLKFSELHSNECDFRLRFKITVLKNLQRLDVNAFSYYFDQARHDITNSKVLDLNYSKFKDELLGLGVADMYREMVEKQSKEDDVLNEYKRFVPNELLKKHRFFLKPLIQKTLQQLQQTSQLDAVGVKVCYLDNFHRLAPTYLCEEYHALKLEGEMVLSVVVRVDPFHPEFPGIQCKEDNRKEWTQLCTIDDVWCIAIGGNSTIEICGNGIPAHLQFASIANMVSFISLVDGYYRLGVRWTVTYSVTRDLTPPSLLKLQRMKCHGPVGAKFASEKLKKRCNYQRGSFILRESETHYDTYLLDVCLVEGKPPEIFTIEPTVGIKGFMLAADGVRHESVPALIASLKAEGSRPWLNYCLPPSEYDKLDNLLLCRAPRNSEGKATVSTESKVGGKHDIIDVRAIILGQELKGKYSSACSLYRGQWIADKDHKVEVAVRRLTNADYGEEFQRLAMRWAQLRGSMTVRLLGISFAPCSLVLELLPMGPLNKYLRGNRANVKGADLVEAAACLASAVWYLEGENIIHGNIRCRKVLVCNHDESSMSVKLSDPGLPNYSNHDLHWLPPECYNHPASARSSSAADVWAFGTTVWEIFSYGEELRDPFDTENVKKYYSSGGRLPRPIDCPNDILHIMKECWHEEPELRKQPQGLMRDLNQILYQAFSSRRAHIYTAAYPKRMRKDAEDSMSFSNSESMLSAETVSSTLDPTILDIDSDRESICPTSMDIEDIWLLGEPQPLLTPTQLTTMLDNAKLDTSGPSKGEEFELDRECTVVLQGRIGVGFYGEVFKGSLDRFGGLETEVVAVKKLKLDCNGLEDFERESSIMKKLKHPNIVRLIGIVHEPEVRLVMEYVPLGSLLNYMKIPRKEPLTHHELLKFALDVATGMEYLGEQNIVHRDLATRNILVATPDMVKISDFGLAQTMSSPSQYYFMQTSRELPIQWYALESLQNGRFSARSDVWSFGVAVWEMFTGGSEPHLPGCEDRDQSGMVAALERGIRLTPPDGCPQSVYSSLMHPCWLVPSIKRPTFTQLCHAIRQLNDSLF